MTKSQFEEFWYGEYHRLAKLDIPIHEKTHDLKAIMRKRKELLSNFLKKIAKHNLRILDVGCGVGVFCNFIHDLGHHITGIDYSQNCIDIAKTNCQGRNIDYQVGNIYSLNFPDDNFDLTLCFATLQHVENAQQAINELIRVTKKRGFILLNTKRQPTNLEIFLIRIYLSLFSYHKLKYTPKEIKKIIDILRNRTYLTEKVRDFYFPKRYKVSEIKDIFLNRGIKKIKVYYHNKIVIGTNDMMVAAQK